MPGLPSPSTPGTSRCGKAAPRAASRCLQRAWSITHSYIDFAKRAEAFGDSASGIHGVSGLSWQLGGKPQIEEALGSLRRTYRDKYNAYIENLEGALRGLGQCEAEHFDERDWYGRFGFLYLDFMKAKYESPEP